MAITKTYLNNDLDGIVSFLTSTGLFGSVTKADTTITCKDGSNITLLTIARANDASSDYTWTLTAYIAGNNSVSRTYEMLKCAYGYNCTNGAMLSFTSGSAFLSVVLSMTNRNSLAIILPKSTVSDERTIFYSVAYTDTYPISEFEVSPSTAEQTVLSPFITNSPTGVSSYTPKAFYIPFGEYVDRGYARFNMGGTEYVSDGNFAISDAAST